MQLFCFRKEIIAWQDYKHTGCPWGNNIPDGSWYWYNYMPTQPLPNACVMIPTPGTFSPQRRTRYHSATFLALSRLLEVTSQHVLAGTTTIRNNQKFSNFKNNLIASIKS